MKSTLLTYIDRFRQNRRERLVLGSVLLFLAVIVSLIVYWQLRYTGITMSNETFCGYEEHVHTEECYDEEGNLICELEEHSHTVDCLINLNADVEDATVWKATLPELTGDLRTDVVNIAYSQLGYTESTANFSPGEDGVTRYGYTRYGAWYGNEYGTWDAMFVSFCLNYAGIDRTAFPLNSGAYSWAVELSEIGSYAEASAYTPLAGDIVFFDSDYDGRIDRVGIVASTDISGGVVTIIEGDYTVSEVDTVCEHIYALNDPTISGYGIIAVSEEAEEETEDAEAEETDEEIEETEESEEIEIDETEEETEEVKETEETEIIEVIEEAEEETEEVWEVASYIRTYSYEDDNISVNVILPSDSSVPENAVLVVTELSDEDDDYETLTEQAESAVDGKIDEVHFYDISFYAAYEDGGEYISVSDSAIVTLTFKETTLSQESSSVSVLHYEEIGTEPVVLDTVSLVSGTSNDQEILTFQTEGFSVFAVVTVVGSGELTRSTITSTDELDGNSYIIISYTGTYAMMATESNNGMLKAEVSSTDSSTLSEWTFTKSGNGYYISSGGYYLRMNNNGNLSLVTGTNNATVFTVTYIDTGVITISARPDRDTYYINNYGGDNANNPFKGYSHTGTDTGDYLVLYTLTEATAGEGEVLLTDLDGKSYAIVNLTSKYALTSTEYDNSHLQGVSVTTYTEDDTTYVEGDGVTVWTFESTGTDGVYYISDGNGKYLNISSSAVTVSSTRQAITVSASGGKVRLTSSDGMAVNRYNGNSYFGPWSDSGDNEWQTLCVVVNTDGLTIIDNLVTDGEYEAHLVIDNVAVDLTDSRYTVTWYKSDYTLSADLSTCTNNENYSEVTNSDALGDNNSTVNVAIDQGGLCYYYVEVYDSETNTTYTSAVKHVPYAAELLNCSFEYSNSSTDVPFWETTTEDGAIEIGAYTDPDYYYGTNGIYAGGSQAAAGDHFAELNANSAGALYQDVLTIGGESLNWAFYHRARTADGGSWQGTNITDEMYVVIMSTEDAEKLLAGISQDAQQETLTTMIESILGNNTDGSGTYKLADGDYEGDTVTATIWTVSSTNGYQTGEWTYNSGTYTVPDEQYVTRFFFVSKTSGYDTAQQTENNTVGNLIDYATFSQDITYVIEYWTRQQNSGTYTLVKTETDTAYPYTNVYANISTYTAAGYGLVGSVTGTASGGKNPMDYMSGGTVTGSYTSMFDEYTTTGMRINSGTMYLSVYLSTPVVTVVKEIGGLTESQLDDLLDGETYTVTFTIKDSNGNTVETLKVNVGETGVASTYTIGLTAGETYTISESVNYTGTYLDNYNLTVTVGGVSSANNAIGEHEFTPTSGSSLTITFTNTYAEVVTGGPEMPQTGGRGTKLYTTVGLLLMCSGGYLLYRKQRRKCKWRWNI